MKTAIVFALALMSLASATYLQAQPMESTNNLILLPVANDPTISFKIWFKVGSQNDPAGKEGLAALTAQMLSDGSTQKNSYEQIISKLYPLAAGYNASASKEMTVFSGRTHKDNLNEYYSLLTDAIMAPAFKQEDLDRIKSQILNFLENSLRYASDEELGKAVLYQDIFAGTSYAHVNAGYIESVKSITLEDIKSFYKTYYTKDNLVIGLGGGYDATLVKTLQSDLANLPSGKPKPAAVPEAKPLQGVKVTLVEKDAASTAISMGFPMDILRGTRDWYALAIANSWLGEHRNSSSHLYQVIREKRGLNYGDYSYIENYPNGGQRQLPPTNVGRRKQIFEIWIRPVPNEARHFAMRAALREFKKLVDNGMTQSEFDLTKGFLRKYILHYAETTEDRLGYAIDDAFYGLSAGHLETFRKMMDELTLADVNAAIKKHWQYDNLQIAIITKDAASFRDALLADAPSPMKYANEKPQSVLDEDKEISVFPLKLKPENVRIVPVADLFLH
jgi:zinc protease